ncbi:hypothetical protein [uncultured Gordonia sp.]|uniref:hypothetical protein n=1 Tax=Gordonia sp. (in: high G+C Gram-positive bacteria) TaxID=84139 RepID=UPI000FB71234|nr:hypothetical protein [uncultured Gordonia sp.]RUP37012.1 MAG: hypothetical protein EKK60_13585 [Gordonia sp. (in: high G+C Gram-positive bacteria)]
MTDVISGTGAAAGAGTTVDTGTASASDTPPTAPVSLHLPDAPAVPRALAPSRRRWPAVALISLGVVLIVAPFALGLFGKVAAGQQLLDRFAPLLTDDSLARYDADLALLRDAAGTVGRIGEHHGVPADRYPGVATYIAAAPGIDGRGTGLIGSVRAGTADFGRLAAVGGFDRLPLILVIAGIAFTGGGIALLRADAGGARIGAVAAAIAGVGLVAFAASSGVLATAGPAQALVDRFAPIMNEAQVRALQTDFVTVVGAVGEIDTGYPGIRVAPSEAAELTGLKAGWPQASRDLADLVGQINDNIANYRALVSLGRLSPIPGTTGWQLLPAVCIGAGVAGAVLAAAGLRTKQGENS